MNEQPVVFESSGIPLLGMLHRAAEMQEIGVLVMVAGGPQYRIGGHRQLVLWARQFAANGFPVLRFDFKGMGDSYGEFLDFDNTDGDIKSALDQFFAAVPSLKGVVLWGECNASSASLFYAHKDPRVRGIVMINPWVRTEQGQAKAVVKHYYLNRIMQKSFWRKVFSLQFDVIGSLRSAKEMIATARGKPAANAGARVVQEDSRPLPERMFDGLKRFRGQIMLIMSGRDMVSKEFDDLLQSRPEWKLELAVHQAERHDLQYADHTFSCKEWRDQVGNWGVDWLKRLAKSTIKLLQNGTEQDHGKANH